MKPRNDPPRLLDPDAEAPELLREALRAGVADVPSPERLGRLAERLAGILDAPLPPSPGGGGSAPLPKAAPVKPIWSLPAFKVGLGLLLTAGIGGALWALEAPRRAGSIPVAGGAPALSASSGAPDSSTRLSSAAAAPPDLREPIRVEDLPNATEEKRPPGRGAASGGPERGKTEAQLLQQAQADLGADPARALAETLEHARRFPGGALGQESDVIAITALQRLGRLGEARARAARFLAQFPTSAHRRRMEALVGGGSSPGSPADAGAPPAAP